MILEQRKAVLPRLAMARVALPAFLQAVVLPGPSPVAIREEQLAVQVLVVARVALPVNPLTAVLFGPNPAWVLYAQVSKGEIQSALRR